MTPLFESQLVANVVQQIPSTLSPQYSNTDITDSLIALLDGIERRSSSAQKYDVLIRYGLAEYLATILLKPAQRLLLLESILLRFFQMEASHTDHIVNLAFFENHVLHVFERPEDPIALQIACGVMMAMFSGSSQATRRYLVENGLLEGLIVFLSLHRDSPDKTYGKVVQLMRVMASEETFFAAHYVPGLFSLLLGVIGTPTASTHFRINVFKLLANLMRDGYTNHRDYMALAPPDLYITLLRLLVQSGTVLIDILIAEFIILALETMPPDGAVTFNISQLRALENKLDGAFYASSVPFFSEECEERLTTILQRKVVGSYLSLLMNKKFQNLISQSEPFCDFLLFTLFFQYVDLIYENCIESRTLVIKLLRRFLREQSIRKEMCRNISLGPLLTFLIRALGSDMTLLDIVEDLITIFRSSRHKEDQFADIFENPAYCESLIEFVARGCLLSSPEVRLLALNLLADVGSIQDFVTVLFIHRYPEIFQSLIDKLLRVLEASAANEDISEDSVLCAANTLQTLADLSSSDDGFRALLANPSLDALVESLVQYSICADTDTPVFKLACLRVLDALLKPGATIEHNADKLRIIVSHNILEGLLVEVLEWEYKHTFEISESFTVDVTELSLSILISIINVKAFSVHTVIQSRVVDDLALMLYGKPKLFDVCFSKVVSLFTCFTGLELFKIESELFYRSIRAVDFFTKSLIPQEGPGILWNSNTDYFSEFYDALLLACLSSLRVNLGLMEHKFELVDRLLNDATSVMRKKHAVSTELDKIFKVLAQFTVDFEYWRSKSTVTHRLLDLFEEHLKLDEQVGEAFYDQIFLCVGYAIIEDGEITRHTYYLIIQAFGLADRSEELDLFLWKVLYLFSLDKTKYFKDLCAQLLSISFTGRSLQNLVVNSLMILQFFVLRTLAELMYTGEISESRGGNIDKETVDAFRRDFPISIQLIDELLGVYGGAESGLEERIYYLLLSLRDAVH